MSKPITVAELQKKINHEIDTMTKDKTYEGSADQINAEMEILTRAEEMGYDVQMDDVASEYFLKATPIEVWVYWMTEIIPNWEKKIKSTQID